jgi:hypothetical protein
MNVKVLSDLVAVIARLTRWLGGRSAVLRLARLLFEPLREHLARKLRRQRRIANFYDFPLRFEFAHAAKQEPPRFRVVVYGAFFEIWNPALADPKLWQIIPGVAEVLRVANISSLNFSAPSCADMRTVIIPLGEQHYRECAGRHLSLVPDARAITILSNKASFAAYTDGLGLSRLCPESYKEQGPCRIPFRAQAR